MSLPGARGQLHRGLSDLMRRWSRTRETWDDGVAAAFQKQYLEPLEPASRAAMEAMEEMNALLMRARAECGEDRQL